jgi:hypothetical protein
MGFLGALFSVLAGHEVAGALGHAFPSGSDPVKKKVAFCR